MKAYFDIPPAQHRGWPGQADVYVELHAGVPMVCIDPCAASGGVNGGRNYRYAIELTPWQLVKLAVALVVVRVFP